MLSHIFFDCISGNTQIDRKMFCTPHNYKYKQKLHANTYSDVSLLSKRSWWPFFMQMEHVWDILHQEKDAAALCNRRKLQQSSNVKTFARNFTIQILIADSTSRAGCSRQNLETKYNVNNSKTSFQSGILPILKMKCNHWMKSMYISKSFIL